MMTKSQSVLTAVPRTAGRWDSILFIRANGEVRREVEIDAKDWFEMSKPEEITVTIEPGDRLNT